ncbi:MAG TPA: T9SS type A sorting domain-containing protein [Candidatus Kapabacteria bacterium]|nr:T9SS type A sorting domain-containing protein [Candidatus Kapabacteria bacterium]
MKRVFVLLALLQTSLGLAQGVNSAGKDFYLGWLYPSYNDQNLNLAYRDPKPYYNPTVLISSYSDNEVTISYFDDKVGKEWHPTTYTISHRRSIQVQIDRTQMRMDGGGPNGFDGEVAQWRAMHITSKKPITVQFFSSGANSGGSYLAIPTNLLGKEYVVESYHDNPNGTGGYLSHELSSGYFLIVAPIDGTTIQITPAATTKARRQPGVNCGTDASGIAQPFTIALQRGQCYLVKSQGKDSLCDISGSTVISDKPIAVIAGHENVYTDGSSIGNITVEGRDYMIEQMLPVKYWDSTGYISLPFIDSKNAPGGGGDNLAFMYGKLQDAPSNYPDKATIKLLPDSIFFNIEQYSPTNRTSITTPTSASSSKGAKFHVVQYDQRMQGGAPYPAPSQLTLIPKSRWSTFYLWDVPANTNPAEVYQGYYLNVICDKNDYDNGTLILASDPFTPMKSYATANGIKTIPGYPDLIGLTIKLNAPRTYFAFSTAKKPFVVYNYGFRAIDADRDLGDFDGDDFFFSYASPVGFLATTGDSSFFSTSIDTLCAKWDLCAKVSGTHSPKIQSVSILNDPGKIVVDKPNSATGYDSYNVRFDPRDDPDDKGEINLEAADSSKCVRLFVADPLLPAHASLMILDDHGNYHISELDYQAPQLADTITGNYFDITKARPGLLGYHKDTIVYPIAGIGDSHCATISYFVRGDSAKGVTPATITAATLGGADKSFTISPLQFPIILRPASASHPADTLKINICFNSKDTASHQDTLSLTTDCFTAPVLLLGQGGTPLITATDYDFGNVVIGETNCTGRITLQNVGNLPFTLTNNWVLHNIVGGKNFTISQSGAARFPFVLYPINSPNHLRQDTINLYFCYTPTNEGFDSSIITWNTGINPPFADQIKNWSYLKGNGVKPGLIWSLDTLTFHGDSTVMPAEIDRRINLYSTASGVIRLEKTFIDGPDMAEFAMIGNQINQNPLEGVDLSSGDTLWVDIAFTPDYTKPYPQKFADRHANLNAVFFTDAAHTQRDTSVAILIGTFGGKLSVAQQATITNDLQAYYSNHQLTIKLPESSKPPYECSLYDILGRKIHSWHKQTATGNTTELKLELPSIQNGMYILRINDERSCTFVVQ